MGVVIELICTYSTGIYFNESVIICGGTQVTYKKMIVREIQNSSDNCYILQVRTIDYVLKFRNCLASHRWCR